MNKNIIIGLLALVAIAEGAVLALGRSGVIGQTTAIVGGINKGAQQSPPPPGQNPQMAMLVKGMDFSKSPISLFAYQIAPGAISPSAKQALTGFSMTTHANTDGSLQITITPTASNNQSQQYTLRQGEKLYFVEMTPLDDNTHTDQDINYRDDYGVIVDANGIVQ